MVIISTLDDHTDLTTMQAALIAQPTPRNAAPNAAPNASLAGLTSLLAELPMESKALLQGRKAVTIMHNGALYRLQATRLGKLILTK
ncbi:hypothetical protein MASR1M59_19360 [Melaminivora sp.]